MLCLLYTVPPMRNFFRHLKYYILAELNTLECLFPSAVNEWNDLNHDIRSCSSESVFCNTSITFVSPIASET